MIQIQLSYPTIEAAQEALALLNGATPVKAAKKSPKSKQREPIDPADLKIPVPVAPADMAAHAAVPTAPVVPEAPADTTAHVTAPVAPATVPVVPVAPRSQEVTPQEINVAMKAAAAKVGDAGASCFAIIKEIGCGLAEMTPAQLKDVLVKVQAL